VGIDIGSECWHRERKPDQLVGYSVVRRCKILDVGVCGIAGMGVHDILIEDSLFEGTGWQKMELSWEAGAIKVHNCVNGLIRRNVFRNTIRADALWMDVGNINNRITGNLFLNGLNAREHLFMECTRDAENLIDNNIFWNIEGRFNEKDVKAEAGSAGWYKLKRAAHQRLCHLRRRNRPPAYLQQLHRQVPQRRLLPEDRRLPSVGPRRHRPGQQTLQQRLL
jgi:hypothetical protein